MKLFSKMPLMVLLGVFTLFSCSTDSFDDNVDALEISLVDTQTKAIELEILDLINEHRLSLGLNSLEDMSIVKSVAYSHTDYMVDNDIVSHDNFYTRSDYLKSNIGAKKSV